MAIISRLKPGQIVYDVQTRRMGNTTMHHKDVFVVRIIEVFADHVIASWNSNRPLAYYLPSIKRWKVKRPVVPPSIFEQARDAMKQEVPAQ